MVGDTTGDIEVTLVTFFNVTTFNVTIGVTMSLGDILEK